MPAQLGGVLSALVVPFTADGSIDESRLRAVVDHNIAGGVHGVVACGSTGEFATMSSDERRRVVEVVVDQTAGRVPVVAQTGAVSTTEAIALSKHAAALGVDALMLVTPYYEALSMQETLHYLRRVASAVDVPIMLYNLPAATGVNLEPAVVGQLAREVQNIKYIKDTSADMAQAGRLIHHHSDVISTFVGWDSLMLAALTEGAAGVMCGTANALAPQLVAVHDAIKLGDFAAARTMWNALYPLMDTIMSSAFIQAVKATCAAIGLDVGVTREPLLPLDPNTQAAIARHVANLGLRVGA